MSENPSTLNFLYEMSYKTVIKNFGQRLRGCPQRTYTQRDGSKSSYGEGKTNKEKCLHKGRGSDYSIQILYI
jgi:hypothetical protein